MLVEEGGTPKMRITQHYHYTTFYECVLSVLGPLFLNLRGGDSTFTGGVTKDFTGGKY